MNEHNLAREHRSLLDALTKALDDLDRERAAHRETSRREARAQLERANAEEALADASAMTNRLEALRVIDRDERSMILIQLGQVQAVAQARLAELTTLLADQRLGRERQSLLLLRLGEVQAALVAAREAAAASAGAAAGFEADRLAEPTSPGAYRGGGTAP